MRVSEIFSQGGHYGGGCDDYGHSRHYGYSGYGHYYKHYYYRSYNHYYGGRHRGGLINISL